MTAYLRDFATVFWKRFDAALEAHAGDPREQLRELFRRSAFESYAGTDLLSDAASRARELLATHQIEPLADDVEAAVRKVIARHAAATS